MEYKIKEDKYSKGKKYNKGKKGKFPLMPKKGYPVSPGQENCFFQETGRILQTKYRPPLRSHITDNKVVQMAEHVKLKDNIDNENVPTLETNEKPTMIYESMGTGQGAVDNVYAESQRYTGNTVCIFGLNKRKDDLNDTLQKLSDKTEAPHFLRNFSFLWKKPENVAETAPYKMPFIEARLLVMQKAEEVTDAITAYASAHPAPAAAPSVRDRKHQFIYRWIDQDAKDDTSDDLDITFLHEFSKNENPRLATGTYRWRHNDPLRDQDFINYSSFIDQINTAEYQLRKKYFDLIHSPEQELHFLNNDLISERSKIKGDKYKVGAASKNYGNKNWEGLLSAYIDQLHKSPLTRDQQEAQRTLNLSFSRNSYLPGFYLPEPVLLMNAAAHSLMWRNYRRAALGSNSQERESMKISEFSQVQPQDVSFISELHVSKPLKDEFTPQKSYFFNTKMITLFTGDFSPEKLKNALGSLRQSAFDSSKWYIENNDVLSRAFEDFKNTKITEIQAYLQAAKSGSTNYKLIQGELRSHTEILR